MKKIIGFVVIVFLTAFIAASMFAFPELKNEASQWTLLFFDLIAAIQICVFLWMLKQED
jgi:hypothetical protein